VRRIDFGHDILDTTDSRDCISHADRSGQSVEALVITSRRWAYQPKSCINPSGSHDAKRPNRVFDSLSWCASPDEHEAQRLSRVASVDELSGLSQAGGVENVDLSRSRIIRERRAERVGDRYDARRAEAEYAHRASVSEEERKAKILASVLLSEPHMGDAHS
jgi:hypothetical protein